MAQVVAVSVSQAVSATANAVATVAASDTKSAENISGALKSYIDNLTSIPRSAADVAQALAEGIGSRGGAITDNVGEAIKVISTDLYDAIQSDPNNIKRIGQTYVSAVDEAVRAARRNIHAVTETAEGIRGAIVENVSATAVLPLQIATGVLGKIKRTIFGGSSSVPTNVFNVLLVVFLIVLIVVLYFEMTAAEVPAEPIPILL
jgi:hypothetical protein